MVSDFGSGANQGVFPFGVAVEPNGPILVIDLDAGTGSQGALFRVDPVTGDRTLVSDFGSGANPGIDPIGLAVVPAPDTTPPVITPSISGTLGNNGWYVSDVTVSWTVEDDESAVTATSGCDATTITSDTAGTTLTCEATSDGGTASESVTIKRDATAPTLAPSVAPNPVVLNGSATASPNAGDATSGVAIAGCDAVDTSAVGPHGVSCTATDQAGNSASATASYTVVYAFAGFSQPVDNPLVLNLAKAGQTVPLKWRLLDANGVPVTNLTSVTVTAESLACVLGTTPDQLEEYAAGGSGLQNLGDGYYQFNWKTPKSYANFCKTLMLDLGEGIVHQALFQFTK